MASRLGKTIRGRARPARRETTNVWGFWPAVKTGERGGRDVSRGVSLSRPRTLTRTSGVLSHRETESFRGRNGPARRTDGRSSPLVGGADFLGWHETRTT